MYAKPPRQPTPTPLALPPRAHSLGSTGRPGGGVDAAVEEIQQLAAHAHASPYPYPYHDSPHAGASSGAHAHAREFRPYESERAVVATGVRVASAVAVLAPEEEEGEVESVSSSASLPRVTRGAASFAAKDIGDSGMKVRSRLF